MGMTIDGSIKELSKWRKDLNYDNGDYCYGDDTTRHSLDTAIDTMRKYQKIEWIIEVWHQDIYTKDFECIAEVAEVIEDGKID